MSATIFEFPSGRRRAPADEHPTGGGLVDLLRDAPPAYLPAASGLTAMLGWVWLETGLSSFYPVK